MTGTRASGPKRRQRSGIERPSLRYPMTERGTRGRPGRQWPEAMADRENPTTPWDRPFAGWQETMSAHEIKRMQRHIERLQAAMGPHSTHSPQRPHERTSSEPAQGPHLVEIAGPDGSGKTTVMRRTVDLSWFPGARGVDADALAAALPGGFVKPGTRRARHLPPNVTVTTPGRSRPDILGETLLAAHGDAIRARSKARGILSPPRLCRPARPGRQCRSRRSTLRGGRVPFPWDMVDRY